MKKPESSTALPKEAKDFLANAAFEPIIRFLIDHSKGNEQPEMKEFDLDGKKSQQAISAFLDPRIKILFSSSSKIVSYEFSPVGENFPTKIRVFAHHL